MKPRHLAPLLAPLLALFVVLAGCAGTTPTVGPAEVPPAAQTLGQAKLAGWVTDPTVAPVAGARVSAQGTNASTTTDEGGRFALDALPPEVPLVVVAEAPGYRVASKSLTLAADTPTLLNFTLEPIPAKVPHHEVIPLAGFLACQAAAITVEEERHLDCGTEDPNNKGNLEIAVGPDTAGIVFELQWDPGTPAAKFLSLTIETVGFGDQDAVLSRVQGQSVLRAQVNAHQAERYYAGSGGIVRATIEAGVDPDEEESTVGASVHVQQNFQLFVGVFYVESPDPTYTAVQ